MFSIQMIMQDIKVDAIPDGEVKVKMMELAATKDIENMNKALDYNLFVDA